MAPTSDLLTVEEIDEAPSGLANWWPLIPVVAVAAGVRIVGLDWGLPYVYDFDEPNNLIRTLTMLREGDPNPHWFHYGSLMFYLYGGVIAAAVGVRSLLDGGLSLSSLEFPEMIAAASGFMSEPWTLVLTRSTSIALSVATVVVIYLVVRKLIDQPWPAAAAAGLFALAPVAVTEGRLFSPNTLSALLAAVAIGASIRVYQTGLGRSYVIAGLVVGLAAGAKYNAGLVGICVLIAHWLRVRDGKSTLFRGPLNSIYAAAGAFLITTPFAVLDAPEFLGDVGFELAHYSSGHVGSDGSGAFLLAFFVSFSLALFLVPFAVISKRHRGPSFIMLGYGVFYLAGFALLETVFSRNLLPVLPAFCVAAGLGADAAWEHFGSRSGFGRFLVAAGLIGALFLSLLTTSLEYRELEDRTEASAWIASNLAEGSLVVVDTYSPWIDPSVYSVREAGFLTGASVPLEWEYMILTERGSGRFDSDSESGMSVAQLRSDSCVLARFPGVAEVRAPVCP